LKSEVENRLGAAVVLWSACTPAAITLQLKRLKEVSAGRLLTAGRSAFTPFELPTAAALPGLQSQSELTAAALPPCTTSPLAARSLHPLSTPQAIPPSVYDKPIAS
jgi:hypothetical protein